MTRTEQVINAARALVSYMDTVQYCPGCGGYRGDNRQIPHREVNGHPCVVDQAREALTELDSQRHEAIENLARAEFEEGIYDAQPTTKEWIEWVEPFGPQSEPVYMRVSPETAIAVVKNLHPEITDDNLALEDFMVVNWAQRVFVDVRPVNVHNSER